MERFSYGNQLLKHNFAHLNTSSASGLRPQYTDEPAARATARSGAAPCIEVNNILGERNNEILAIKIGLKPMIMMFYGGYNGTS